MYELKTDVCVITETWLRSNPFIEQVLDDFEQQYDYEFIRRDREDGRRGGGVAICYNKKTIAMSRIRLPPTKHEIVGAIGRRVGQRRKVAVLAVYLPPALRSDQLTRCLRDFNDCIVHIKQKYTDPYIVAAGDFNRTDTKTALAEHTDIVPVTTGPTRGAAVLDIVATNFNQQLVEAGTTDPIRSERDVPTDHLTVFMAFKMSRVPEYVIEKYSYYHEDEEGHDKFGRWLVDQDWRKVYEEADVDKKVDALHGLFEDGMMFAYEWKTRV